MEGRRCLSYVDSLFSKYLWSTSVCQVLQLHPWGAPPRGREPLLRGHCGQDRGRFLEDPGCVLKVKSRGRCEEEVEGKFLQREPQERRQEPRWGVVDSGSGQLCTLAGP